MTDKEITREQELRIAAQKTYVDSKQRDAFVNGGLYADENPQQQNLPLETPFPYAEKMGKNG